MASDLSDYREQLQHRCTEATRALGVESAQIMAKASRDGALSNSRLVFPLIDALEIHWRQLIDDAISDARAFELATKKQRSRLVAETKVQLGQILPTMIESSQVDRSRSGFKNTSMLQPASDRVAALSSYLDMRLRQYQQGIGDPVEDQKRGWWPSPKEIVAGLIVSIVIAIGTAIIL